MILISKGSVTRANMKISAIDGTSFIDFSAADILTKKRGCYLVVKDSAAKPIIGYIKAAGTGETLDADLLSGLDINDGSWTPTSVTINSSSMFTLTDTAGAVYKNILTTGILLKASLAGSTTGSYFILAQFGMSQKIINANAGYGYRTATSVHFQFQCGGVVGNTATITSADLYKVLTPSATGVTIVSTKGGATYNWASKDAAFNYNDASGYTYEIYDFGRPQVQLV